jgi:hypothetical protein
MYLGSYTFHNHTFHHKIFVCCNKDIIEVVKNVNNTRLAAAEITLL